MKKLLSLLLCLCLIAPISAFAEALSLSEKLIMQIEAGSGFKGKYSLYIGENKEADPQFNGELNYIKRDNIKDISVYDSANSKLLELYQNGEDSFIFSKELNSKLSNSSKKLSDKFVNFFTGFLNIPSSLLTVTDILMFKPNFNMETGLLEKQKHDEINKIMDNALKKYSSEIDIWLQNYMFASEKKKMDSGMDIMGMEYLVPMKAVKDYLKYIVGDMLKDDILTDALSKSLPPEYAQLLLLINQGDFINLAIDSLPIQGDVKLGKTFTFKGEELSTQLILPMYDAETGAYNLEYIVNSEVTNVEKTHNIKLYNEEQNISVSFVLTENGDIKNYKGEFLSSNKQKPENNYNVDFDINTSNKFFVDEQGKNTLESHIDGTIANGEKGSSKNNIDSYSFNMERRYKSGVAKNTSTALLLKAEVINISKNTKFAINMDGKTTAFWEVEEPNTNDVESLDLNTDKDWEKLFTAVSSLLKQNFAGNNIAEKLIDDIYAFISPNNFTAPFASESTIENQTEPATEATAAPAPESTATPTMVPLESDSPSQG